MIQSNPKILVIDDEIAFRKVIRKLLETEFKAEVVEAGDPREALNYLSTQVPSLILLDMEMPFMDGFATLKQIRNMPAVCNVPVIACTALSSVELLNGLAKLQISDFILKPCDVKTILTKVGSIFGIYPEFYKK